MTLKTSEFLKLLQIEKLLYYIIIYEYDRAASNIISRVQSIAIPSHATY